LQALLPPWLATIIVAVLWAAWHLPLFLIHWSNASPLQFILILTGLSLVMAFCFNSSGALIPVAILMHSAFNASPRFLPAFLANVPTIEYPSPETLLAASFLALGALLAILTQRPPRRAYLPISATLRQGLSVC
jgi:membrane protease YdiL (CAAX protease family)